MVETRSSHLQHLDPESLGHLSHGTNYILIEAPKRDFYYKMETCNDPIATIAKQTNHYFNLFSLIVYDFLLSDTIILFDTCIWMSWIFIFTFCFNLHYH